MCRGAVSVTRRMSLHDRLALESLRDAYVHPALKVMSGVRAGAAGGRFDRVERSLT